MTRTTPSAIRVLLPLMLAAAMPVGALAADPESAVTGSGSSAIEKPADALRLQVQLEVEGTSLKDALDKMKTRKEQIKAGLVKIGANEKSIEPGEITVSDGNNPNDRQAAMQRALRERMGGRGGATSQAGPTKVTVACSIKADFALKADAPEAMILAANDIKEKVKSSKLLEAPKSAAMTEAEEEAAMMVQEQGQPSPNEPNYFYVAKISEAERDKAMADAFAKAKDSAAHLAKAAGSELGALKSLQGNMSADAEESMAMQEYGGSYYYRQMAMQRYAAAAENKEAIGISPAKVTMQVMVQASFSLK